MSINKSDSITTTISEDEEIVTMQDAVNEMQTKEEESIAVFGAGDENNCTYDLGYMERQAVFSCKTCDPIFSESAGICFGCSIHCHVGHELIELYTKRNFKCDCGNSKFDNFKCSLKEEKDEVNVKNNYNQNYSGLYCTCKRPYPDPDDEIEDEMIQCVICEDWYHSRHLGFLPPPIYSELICDSCITEHKFFQSYKHLTEPEATVVTKGESTNDVDVTSCEGIGSKRKYEKITGKLEHSGCKLDMMLTSSDKQTAMYFRENWRKDLCTCESCMKMYTDKCLSFITQHSDTIAEYERKGKHNADQAIENAVNTISQMNRVQQVELIRGYNDLKANLHEFLSGFRDKEQVVRKEDIEKFFEEMKERKKQHLDAPPPENCR